MKTVLRYTLISGLILLTLGLLIWDSPLRFKNSAEPEVKAKVLSVNNDDMVQTGMVKIGSQRLRVKILSGQYRGQEFAAMNVLMGQIELDNYYEPGDTIIAAIGEQNGQVFAVKAIDLYRQHWEFVLFALFAVALIWYAGYVGLKAIFSFAASLYVIWRFLIPGLLEGYHPIILSAAVLILLTAVIIFSVAGFTRKGLAALTGTLCGLFLTIGITIIFGEQMGLQGMTEPYAQTLLFSGYIHLNLKQILYAAIVIGASGAAMDIAMDIAASMEEIKIKRPDITARELIQSGFNIGRSVIGTMTTTLLLAYSGGYLTLLMLFMSKNTSLTRILNMKMVCSEILRTLTGSMGLLLVAPITAVFAGWIYSVHSKALPKMPGHTDMQSTESCQS